MRIRSVKPDYWKDARLHNTPGITADVREFYIGLWGVADDAGFLRFDVAEIAGELYRFRNVKSRERNVIAWAVLLAGLDRLRVLECGHGQLPTLTKHQRLGGNRSEAAWKEHQKCITSGLSVNPESSGRVQTSLDVSESSPTVREGRGGEVKGGDFSDNDLTNIADPALRARLQAKAHK